METGTGGGSRALLRVLTASTEATTVGTSQPQAFWPVIARLTGTLLLGLALGIDCSVKAMRNGTLRAWATSDFKDLSEMTLGVQPGPLSNSWQWPRFELNH